ncbi:hypothetical protein EGW08_002641, partial [Elysia chlorotica]
DLEEGLHPLALVVLVADQQGVCLALPTLGKRDADQILGCGERRESVSERAELDVSVRQIFHHELAGRDGLAVDLVHLPPLLEGRARHDRRPVKQKHVQFAPLRVLHPPAAEQ